LAVHAGLGARRKPSSAPDWDWFSARRICLREARRFLAQADAEDAVQNALTRAWKSRASCRTPEAPLPWLLRITRNEALRALEGRRRISEREPSADAMQIDEPAPASELDAVLGDLALNARLARLRPEERDLVRLRYVDDVPDCELARIFQVSEATVRVRLHRIRERARKLLVEG
jgi:RNA polymerase sigma-70 factor, ECF subfamily